MEVENAKRLLQDPKGKPSSMRIALVCVVGLVMVMWVVFCFIQMELLDIPPGAAALAGTLGMGKTVQAWREYQT